MTLVRCQNPEFNGVEPCTRTATRHWKPLGIQVCVRCYKRFHRRGSGAIHLPWYLVNERKRLKRLR